jgi:hypothetical protein
MGDCKQIWIFCNELTESMIQEITEAKKLGLEMKFFNVNQEELNDDNYLLHTEIGPAYRRLIAEHYGDRFYIEGSCGDCSVCRRNADHSEAREGADHTEVKAQHKEEGSSCSGSLLPSPERPLKDFFFVVDVRNTSPAVLNDGQLIPLFHNTILFFD